MNPFSTFQEHKKAESPSLSQKGGTGGNPKNTLFRRKLGVKELRPRSSKTLRLLTSTDFISMEVKSLNPFEDLDQSVWVQPCFTSRIKANLKKRVNLGNNSPLFCCCVRSGMTLPPFADRQYRMVTHPHLFSLVQSHSKVLTFSLTRKNAALIYLFLSIFFKGLWGFYTTCPCLLPYKIPCLPKPHPGTCTHLHKSIIFPYESSISSDHTQVTRT